MSAIHNPQALSTSLSPGERIHSASNIGSDHISQKNMHNTQFRTREIRKASKTGQDGQVRVHGFGEVIDPESE